MNSQATVQPGRPEGVNIGGIHTFPGTPYAKPPHRAVAVVRSGTA